MQDGQFPDKRQLYQFRLDRILGRGGTGTVYRGLDPATNQVVAIKLFDASFFHSKLHLMNFTNSIAKFKKFAHPNVAQIYDFVQGEEGACLILEYVDGPDLRWFIDNRPWNLRERLVVGAQICNGLQYIHDCKFTHHDLKPSNILFTRKGQVKLVDYSLCSGGFLLSIFASGLHEQVTPLYVAPELIRKEPATAQSDIYSLGITFYELFTNTKPFQVDNIQQLYSCHLRVTPPHPTEINAKCPHTLGEIIMKMLSKQPEQRYLDCDQLRIALSEVGRSRI